MTVPFRHWGEVGGIVVEGYLVCSQTDGRSGAAVAIEVLSDGRGG